jgi:hypothetical protein
MTSERQLLAASFRYSAGRIFHALAGTLSISNTKTPGSPGPSSAATVVGRCGQGGQHEFFRVSRAAVISAAQQIPQMDVEAEDAIDLVVAVCRSLRQQTTFDHATQCLNDAVPSIVPLMPPEDIWCDGRELPLDV